MKSKLFYIDVSNQRYFIRHVDNSSEAIGDVAPLVYSVYFIWNREVWQPTKKFVLTSIVDGSQDPKQTFYQTLDGGFEFSPQQLQEVESTMHLQSGEAGLILPFFSGASEGKILEASTDLGRAKILHNSSLAWSLNVSNIEAQYHRDYFSFLLEKIQKANPALIDSYNSERIEVAMLVLDSANHLGYEFSESELELLGFWLELIDDYRAISDFCNERVAAAPLLETQLWPLVIVNQADFEMLEAPLSQRQRAKKVLQLTLNGELPAHIQEILVLLDKDEI